MFCTVPAPATHRPCTWTWCVVPDDEAQRLVHWCIKVVSNKFIFCRGSPSRIPQRTQLNRHSAAFAQPVGDCPCTARLPPTNFHSVVSAAWRRHTKAPVRASRPVLGVPHGQLQAVRHSTASALVLASVVPVAPIAPSVVAPIIASVTPPSVIAPASANESVKGSTSATCSHRHLYIFHRDAQQCSSQQKCR